MALRKGETPVEVTRESLVRLKDHALRCCDEAVMGSFSNGYWNGWIRAIEHVIEMESE